MDNNKIQKIFHYIIVLLLVILWFIMMFFPEHIDTMNFKIFFSISLACTMIYSFCRKKYFSMQTYCKTEKFVFTFLIILLFLRFMFWKNQVIEIVLSIVEAAILWDSRFFRKKSFIITFVQPMRKILMGFLF